MILGNLVKVSAERPARTLQPRSFPLPGCTSKGGAVADALTLGAARLSQGELAALTAYAARASWPAGFAVYQRGATADGVFVVTLGRVVLRSRVRAGRGFVPWIATPGESFGS